MRQQITGWCGVALAAAWITLPGRAAADDRGAAASGAWESPATWLGNAVPGPADYAYIGSTYPAGAASTATVSLTQNETAARVYLGFGSGTAGTLQLGAATLTTQALVLGGGGGAASVLRTTGTVAVNGTLRVDGGGNAFAFAAGDTTGNIELVGGGRATTAATGNVTGQIELSGAATKLTLGADLSIGARLYISGGSTVDAQGHSLTVNDTIYLGNSGGGTLVNRGALTANNTLAVYGQAFNLTPADHVNTFSLESAASSVLPVGVVVGGLNVNGGSTATTSSVSNVANGAFVDGAGSTLTLGANLSVTGNVFLTNGGTVNAQGHNIAAGFNMAIGQGSTLLNRGPLTVTNALSVTGQAFNLTAADSVNQFGILSGGSTALPVGVGVAGLSVDGNSTATTAAVGNVTGYAAVSNGSTLTLGANLQLSNSLTVNGGTVNAQGHNVAANTVTLTAAGATPALQNLGTITADSYSQAGGSTVTLGAGVSTIRTVALSQNSTLAIKLLSGSSGRLTVSGTAATDLSIEAGSHLALTLDGTLPGQYALRWANPASGDHVADLNSLIGSGGIAISLTNNAQYTVFSDGNYSYVAVPVPEPGAVLAVICAGLGTVGLARRRLRGRG